jgi:hypothetical protein
LFFLNISFDFKEWGESFYEKIKASKFLAKTFSISLVFMVVFIPFIIVLALIKNFISEEFSKTVFPHCALGINHNMLIIIQYRIRSQD